MQPSPSATTMSGQPYCFRSSRFSSLPAVLRRQSVHEQHFLRQFVGCEVRPRQRDQSRFVYGMPGRRTTKAETASIHFVVGQADNSDLGQPRDG